MLDAGLATFPRSEDFLRPGDLGGSDKVVVGFGDGGWERDGVGITLTLTFVGVEGAVKVLSEIK